MKDLKYRLIGLRFWKSLRVYFSLTDSSHGLTGLKSNILVWTPDVQWSRTELTAYCRYQSLSEMWYYDHIENEDVKDP